MIRVRDLRCSLPGQATMECRSSFLTFHTTVLVRQAAVRRVPPGASRGAQHGTDACADRAHHRLERLVCIARRYTSRHMERS
jgi:hypothetical protein